MNKKLGGQRCKYDDLQSMKYLDQVLCEVLRKWPTGILLDRVCVKDCMLDIGDGKQIKIDKGSYMKYPVNNDSNDNNKNNNNNRYNRQLVSTVIRNIFQTH